MEKSRRLQRYDKKDYSELVEFPVEIVGRDGKVRRYTFEDSIRLYRRRVTFAPIRYRDVELITAEVDHCRARIDQLRRSYFYRYGWGAPEGEPGPVELFGSVAGELAAFLCRVLKVDGRPEVKFEAVQDGWGQPVTSVEVAIRPIGAWFVLPKDSPAGMLLYVHRFEGDDADEVREKFFAHLKDLERLGPTNGDAERLLAFHHTVDCGFVLTARGADFDKLDIARDDDEELGVDPTPWDEAYEALRTERLGEAVGQCRQIVAEQPWHRSAYVGGAAAALHLEQWAVAEDFALVGSRYFRQDGALLYQLGVARARQGRRLAAIEALRESVAVAPTYPLARLLLGVLLLRAGSLREGRAVLVANPNTDDRRLAKKMSDLADTVLFRWGMVTLGYGSAFLGLCATVLAGWLGLVLVVAGVALAWGCVVATRHDLARALDWRRYDDLIPTLERLRPHATPAPAP